MKAGDWILLTALAIIGYACYYAFQHPAPKKHLACDDGQMYVARSDLGTYRVCLTPEKKQ